MDYLEALGQVIREVRVAAGLSREGCAQVLNRDHLAKVEQGRLAISVLKLYSLCELPRHRPSALCLWLWRRAWLVSTLKPIGISKNVI